MSHADPGSSVRAVARAARPRAARRTADAEHAAVAPRPAPAAPIVRLEGLSKRFDTPAGPVVALDGVDLAVERGEVFGIIGRSGAGKSTLIRCINRLERPTAGRVLVGGEDVTHLPAARLAAVRQRIGMIFQHFNLLSSRTVFENVALPLRFAGRPRADIERTVPRLLDLVGLADKHRVYPARLSGGQKQRVGIARALVHDPDILLCDEATSALDPETTLSILRLLQDINARLGVTVILITHEMSVIREVCDRVAVLDAGRVVETGPVWEVFAHPRAEATRRLLGAPSVELPPALAERISPDPAPGRHALLRVRAAGTSPFDPVLTDAARALEVPLSVVAGTVEHIQRRPVANLVVAAPFEGAERLDRLVRLLEARGAAVEVLGYVQRPR
ncbi:MAG TPA: ATP-binding cassette domain-containing protein [Thermodesulfobacteriota bacterium]